MGKRGSARSQLTVLAWVAVVATVSPASADPGDLDMSWS